MNINVIGAPIKYGCDRDGVQLGPDRLRELGVIDIIKNKATKNSQKPHKREKKSIAFMRFIIQIYRYITIGCNSWYFLYRTSL